MQAIFVPKYKIYYRVSPKEPNVLQWSNKPFGPATQWQTAMRFEKPIRALDTDDKTGQGVVVLNDSSTYVGSGVRVWGRKFYPAGTRIYSLYAIGESKMKPKLKIKVHEEKKRPTLTPEEVSAIETACSKHRMPCKVSKDSTFVLIHYKGEEVYVEPIDEYGDGLTITMGVWVYGGMDSNSWATPKIKLNSHYHSFSDTDVTKIISNLIDNVYGLIEARDNTRNYMQAINR